MSKGLIKRAENNILLNEKASLAYLRTLKKDYSLTIEQIRQEIESFFGRYAKANKISLAEAKRRLSAKELLRFRRRVEDYQSELEGLEGNQIEKHAKYLQKRKSALYIAPLEELQVGIAHKVTLLSHKQEEGMREVLGSGYKSSFLRTGYSLNKEAPISKNFTKSLDTQLDYALKKKWLESSFSERIWTNREKLVGEIGRIIPQEFAIGHGVQPTARALAERMGKGYRNAERLVRTEMNNISNSATLDAYKSSGIVEKFQFLATLDSRTSKICSSLDNMIFELSVAEVGVNVPPMHPNCRSTTIPYIEDLEGERIARDEQDKNLFVPSDLNYKEWEEMVMK